VSIVIWRRVPVAVAGGVSVGSAGFWFHFQGRLLTFPRSRSAILVVIASRWPATWRTRGRESMAITIATAMTCLSFPCRVW